ncbi:leucine-rich repeat domain-containing protein [Microcoleus sp. B3-A4]|uniref:DUF6745 domain-containing protein n=1 Tax=Microcoleus sp. B3-A4 TaxID=2818653 RepID=UPI002FD3C3E2
MSEQQPNELMSFSSFADWCRHIDSLSEEARHTVEVLLEKAGTDDAEAAERILSSITELDLSENQITDISILGSLTNLTRLYLDSNEIIDISPLRSLTNLTKLILSPYDNRVAPLSVLGELAQKHLTLSTRPIDAQKATAAVKLAYATIGLEEPEVIIYSSPGDACLQIFNCRLHRPGKQLDWKSISLSIVGEFASPAVWQYELEHMKIESEADSLMSELVEEYAALSGPGFYADSFHLMEFVGIPTTLLLKQIYLTELYISSWGINLSQKAQEIHHCQKLLFEHCGWIFPFEKICYVCDRPRHLRFDSQHRLHAEAEPAIELADGWNFYYYHGVRLPDNYGKVHPNLWKAEWLLSESNAELKRVLIQGIGCDRIIQELAAEQIDSWQEYALLRIDNADVEPIYLLKMTCPSTGFIHALRVPPDLTSAREAIRWVNWDIDPDEFSVQT